MEIKKVACYYRVSTETQVDRDTIENQKQLLPKWAKEQGWEVVAEFEDPGRADLTVKSGAETPQWYLEIVSEFLLFFSVFAYPSFLKVTTVPEPITPTLLPANSV